MFQVNTKDFNYGSKGSEPLVAASRLSDSHSFVRSLHSATAAVRSAAVARSAAPAPIKFSMSAAQPSSSQPSTAPALSFTAPQFTITATPAGAEVTVSHQSGAGLYSGLAGAVRPPIPRAPVEELDEDYDDL